MRKQDVITVGPEAVSTRLKPTRVRGKGQYRTFTPDAMLRVSSGPLSSCSQCAWFVWYCHFAQAGTTRLVCHNAFCLFTQFYELLDGVIPHASWQGSQRRCQHLHGVSASSSPCGSECQSPSLLVGKLVGFGVVDEASPFLIKLSLEFDETAQMMRHRLGTAAIIQVQAAFPVMALDFISCQVGARMLGFFSLITRAVCD